MLKNLIKLVTPPMFIHLAKRLRGNPSTDGYGLAGDYRSWKEAQAASTGYDTNIILEKTKLALLKVKQGDAVYERDSVLFNEAQYQWPLLTGLMWVGARTKGKGLNVLDFGGSLGSTYFQHRTFLRSLPDVKWNIIEQPKYIEVGKKYFEDAHLKFYPRIEDCLGENQPNVIILSSVLQYLERPYDKLQELFKLDCGHIIIDRTPFWDGATDRLCVQKVPPSIYPASYPSWIFSKQQFHKNLHQNWNVMVTFDNPDKLSGPVEFSYQGAIIVRNNQIS